MSRPRSTTTANFVTTIASLALVLLVLISFMSSSVESSSSSNSSSGNNGKSSSSSSTTTATQSRQSPISVAASMVGALGSLVPGLITNVAPLMLLLGIGALIMPSFGLSAMGLLRESRRSANDQPPMPNIQLPPGSPFAQFAARPIQTSPQDLYYFTKRSLPSFMPSFNTAPLLELLERVARAIDNADKRYN